MTAEHMHIGIPVLSKEEGMTYNEDMKFCVSNMGDYDFKIEYLEFEEGIPFPETLPKQPHVAYRVNDLDHRASQTQRIIFGLAGCGPGVRLALVIRDDIIVELCEEK